MKTPTDILAEILAGLDGFAPHETLPSYYVEAGEVMRQLRKRKLDLIVYDG